MKAARLTAGLRNTNYRLEIREGPSPLVLRLYVADASACAREAAILRSLAGRTPVPRVWHAAPEAEPPFALLEWLEGDPLDGILRDCDLETSISLAAACGAALAVIHAKRFPAAGFLGPEMQVVAPMPAWAPTVLSTMAGLPEGRLDPELSDRVRKLVESNARAVEPVWSEAVLAHADFKPWNLLARSEPGRPGGRRLSGILDWEFACAGSRLIDFATFLRDEAARPPGFGDAFAAAYRSGGGSLPEDWRRLTSLVDLLNLLQMLGWSGKRATVDLRRLVRSTVTSIEEAPA